MVRSVPGVDMSGKRGRWRPILWWMDAWRRDLTGVGVEQGDVTNRAAWRTKVLNRRLQMTGHARYEEKDGNVEICK